MSKEKCNPNLEKTTEIEKQVNTNLEKRTKEKKLDKKPEISVELPEAQKDVRKKGVSVLYLSESRMLEDVKKYLDGESDIFSISLDHISRCESCIKALVKLGNEIHYTADEVCFNRFLTLKGELWDRQKPEEERLSRLLWNEKAAGMSYDDFKKFDKRVQIAIKKKIDKEFYRGK